VKTIENLADANAILAALQRGFAVPIGTTLSKNWEDANATNNLITLKDSGFTGKTNHSSGHAYVAVGYRKLPNLPKEGGFCLIVKNSWGPGWGLSGYSCQTWAWWKKYQDPYGISTTIPADLQARSDLVKPAFSANSIILGSANEREESSVTEEDRIPGDLNPAVTADGTIEPSTELALQDPAEVSVPAAEEPPGVQGWSPVALVGPGDNFYRAEIATKDGHAYLRGTIRGQGQPSGAVELEMDGEKLVFEGEEVGQVYRDGTVAICTDEFDPICALRINPEENQLYVEFLYDEMRDYEGGDLPAGDWASFLVMGDISIERLVGEDDGFLYLRLSGHEEAIRLQLEGSEILFQDVKVGSLDPPVLCSGEYENRCAVFVQEGDLELIINW
jgi:hypothetical protein